VGCKESLHVAAHGGLPVLAVDVDVYPAGAALCHKPVVCCKDASNIRHG